MKNGDPYINPRTPDTDNTVYQAEAVTGNLTYPDIYYVLQPHVLMECDNMEMSSARMTQPMFERMCDRVYEHACRTHPELAQYGRMDTPASGVLPANYPPGNPPGDYRRPNRDHRPDRNGFDINDLIKILILNEILNRRRRRVY